VIATAEKVARILRDVLHPDGLNLMQANGRAAGQSVFHFHFHLIPRLVGDHLPVPRHPSETADMNELRAFANIVRERLLVHE
jgi:histidine triad (HIT) family protein